jgi:hypothetical protein
MSASSSCIAIQPDDLTKAKIVHLILNRKTENAAVGTSKGKRRSDYAVYVQKESKIYTINSDIFYNPFVVLHEFYHHIRTKGGIIEDQKNTLICMQKTLLMHTRRWIDRKMKYRNKCSTPKESKGRKRTLCLYHLSSLKYS